ncbi:putative holin [Aeromonas sobria]|uniref:putative holin n=1 Tax=Aeromonas sobria TaxID=646 RepID=UPI003F334CC9
MPEPISTFTATSTLAGLAMLFTLPGLDPAMVLGAFTGAIVFAATAEEKGVLRNITLLIASFITGLLLTDMAADLLANILPVSINVSKAVGALIASSMTVRLLQTAIRNQDRLLDGLFNKRNKP